MKKVLTAKNIRWYTAAATALLALVMLVTFVPYVQAKYTSDTALVDTGVSGVSDVDLDALFALMMNERYPVGSIYISTDPDFTPAGAGFPGTWEAWSQGRVPVGVDDDGLDNALGTPVVQSTGAGQTSGSPGGGANNAQINASGTITPSVTLNPKSAAFSGGSLVYDSKAVNPTLANTSLFATPFTLSNAHMPGHSHTAYLAMSWNTRRDGIYGDNTLSDPGGGTAKTTFSNPNNTGQPASNAQNNTNRWGFSVSEEGGGTINISVPIAASNFTATLTPPKVTLGNPSISVPQQTVNGTTTFSGNQNVTVTDNTVQPYEICNIFRRLS